MKVLLFAIMVSVLSTPLAAQWLAHPTPDIPRAADGKPNLTAPAPRTPDGKAGHVRAVAADSIRNISRNIAADLKPEEIQPWARELVAQRAGRPGDGSHGGTVFTVGPKLHYQRAPGEVHSDTRRDHDAGRRPRRIVRCSWMGARWKPRPIQAGWDTPWDVGKADTLVVESFGFNDKTWLDS